MRANTHTHQRTQETIVTNIIERKFVATAILSYAIYNNTVIYNILYIDLFVFFLSLVGPSPPAV